MASVSEFLSALGNDIAIGTGMKKDEEGYHAEAYGTGYEKRTEDRKRAEAQYQLFHGDEDDKPRQVAKPIYAPPPPKTVEQFYAEFSNKANWGPLPSLGMASSGKRSKPSYKDVELREGGEVRSLFQPYG